MRELPRLSLVAGRMLCGDCIDDTHEANRPSDVVDIVNEFTRDFGRAGDDGFPVAHIEPTPARLIAAQYRCDACDATGKQAIEPGGPLQGEQVR